MYEPPHNDGASSCISLKLVPMEQDESGSQLAKSISEPKAETSEDDDCSLASSYDAEVAYHHSPETSKYARNIDKIIKTATRAMHAKKSTAKFAGLYSDISQPAEALNRNNSEQP